MGRVGRRFQWAWLGASAASLAALSAAPAGAQVQAQRWTLNTSLSASYSDDILFVGAGGPDELIASGAVGLGWTRISDRTQLSLSGFVSYRKFADLDAFDGGLGTLSGSASHEFSSRFRGSLAYGFSSGISALGRDLGGQVIRPDVDVRTHVGRTSLGFDVTPRTKATLSGSLTRFDYSAELEFVGSLLPFVGQGPDLADFGLEPDENGEPIVTDPFEVTRQFLDLIAIGGVGSRSITIDTYRAGLGLSHTFSERTNGSLSGGYSGVRSDGSTLEPRGGIYDAGASLGHSLGDNWDLNLGYAFTRNDAQRPAVDTHNATVGVATQLSEQVGANASAGMGFFDGSNGSTSRTLIGSLSFTGRMDRSFWSLAYSRSATSALALGRSFVSDFASGSVSHAFSRKLSGSLYAAYQNSRDPFADFRYDTQVVGVSLSRRIHERTSVGLTYSYRRLGRQDLPAITGNLLGFSIRYGRVFK